MINRNDLTQNQTKDYIDSGMFQFQSAIHQAILKYNNPSNIEPIITVSTKQFPNKNSSSIERGNYFI